MIRAVIFDLDGTLVRLRLRIKEAKRKLLRRFAEEGVDIGWANINIPTEAIVRKVSNRPRKFLMKIVDEVFTPYEVDAAREAELREDARWVLETLRGEGMLLGVASNNGRVGVLEALRKTGIDRYFNAVITRNDASSMKPNGSIIMKILNVLGVRGEEAVYVGDTIYDVMAARNAGTWSIAIVGGAHPAEMLRNAGPDLIINRLGELPASLRLLIREN